MVENEQRGKGKTRDQGGQGPRRKDADMGLYSGIIGEFCDGENLDIFLKNGSSYCGENRV